MLSDPDPRWFPLINEFARDTPWLHPVMTGYADYGIVGVRRPASGGVVDRAAPADLTLLVAAVWAPLGVLAAVAINQPIVAAVHAPRPYAVLPDIVVLAQPGTDRSFPSDYAVLAGALAAGLWLVDRTLGAVAVIAAAAMAFARVYIAAEYIHDVLDGLALGATLSGFGLWATRPILVRLLRRAEDIRPLRALLVANTAELVRR